MGAQNDRAEARRNERPDQATNLSDRYARKWQGRLVDHQQRDGVRDAAKACGAEELPHRDPLGARAIRDRMASHDASMIPRGLPNTSPRTTPLRMRVAPSLVRSTLSFTPLAPSPFSARTGIDTSAMTPAPAPAIAHHERALDVLMASILASFPWKGMARSMDAAWT